jgi:hypothetical protein
MAFFVPLVSQVALPSVGTGIERAVMDWKEKCTATDFHIAKDVAAFANHLGGVLIIGAQESAGQLAAYVGMTPSEAGDVRDKISKAVKDRCQPPPQIEFEEFQSPNDPDERIVVVNVWPSLQLVGVKIAAHKPTEGYGGESFVYPVRSGTDAMYLTPAQIPMYMTPQVRRVAVLLSKIPYNTEVRIYVRSASHNYGARFAGVFEEENVAKFMNMEGANPAPAIPLDAITSVYETYDSSSSRMRWRVLTTLQGG